MTHSESDTIEERYVEKTRASRDLAARAALSMPGGNTRTFGYSKPYPPVFDRGEGPFLWDADGNRYVDLVYNGLSLIHGHLYPPVMEAVQETLRKGTAWPGSSLAQIEFAEALRDRIPSADLIRFTNTGTEATMLAVKLARHVTGKMKVLKAWDAYHGSYDDLEAGLQGKGEIEGRTELAEFGNAQSFKEKLESGDLAAVILEPVMYTGNVVPPPPGFLAEVAAAARAADALVVLDDCLMFRLAEHGSAEKYDFSADITCVGKWIGGGLPLGAIGASADLMESFNPVSAKPLYHGGSFNGNPVACAAGKAALEELTAERIDAMDRRAQHLANEIQRKAGELGMPVRVSGAGSVMGLSVHTDDLDGPRDAAAESRVRLAALANGVYYGPEGEISMATVIDDEALELALVGISAALEIHAAAPTAGDRAETPKR